MDNIRTLTKDGDKALERVQDVQEMALEKGRQTWKELSAQGKDAMASAQKSTQEAWEDTQELVQKHPAKAIGIALLLGAAIGAVSMLVSFQNKS
jgi:ElaB/YqjD/DUF883 family membrane-anchored ribosome-binding protein